jgi:pyridoxal phosphate enzyme (YggS family)
VVAVADVAVNLEAVRDRIARAGGDADSITVVAVTKQLDAEAVAAAAAAGIRDIGENYAQELVTKAAAAPPGVRWHFLGTVQRNKVKALAPVVSLWHGIDRVAAVDVVAARAPGAAVLIEVNASGEPGKGGCGVAYAPELVAHARTAGLEVRGLMTVAPLGSPDAARVAFRRLAELRDELALVELSMGMSGDLEIAVQEGATIVRIGTALFGPRPMKRQVRR